jgi:hypothetical protein
VADLLKNELGIESLLIKGKLGEFSVLVGEKTVARKGWLAFPSDLKVLARVRQALAA